MKTSTEDPEVLIHSLDAHVDLLLAEFQQAGVTPAGGYDTAFHEDTRRMVWPGQSPDGRKWDENMEKGEPARPWNGSSDTRVPVVDGIINFSVALLTAAFRKAELRASTVNVQQMPLTAEVSKFLHWMVHTKYRKQLRLEAELSAQYAQEYGFCVAFIGWERTIGKRRVKVSLAALQQAAAQAPEGSPMQAFPAMLVDPTQDDASAELLRGLYRMYALQQLTNAGFYEEELEEEQLLDLNLTSAKKFVRELREDGEVQVPMPYVCQNDPLVRVCKPYTEVVAARGTLMLQQARALFWRRWLTVAELESKRADGWDPEWIDAVKETKGQVSNWAAAAGGRTKVMGDTTWVAQRDEQSELIEVVYAYVKKVDEDGVTGVYETIFSPHATQQSGSSALPEDACDFCARHQLLGYAHGQYPFVELKRENLGRGLTDTRSVGQIAGTWQNEEKKQRDMLFNRADWDTLPPVKVPKLGGVDYKLGPGAQVPMARAQDIAAINLNAPAPTLALELVKLLKLQSAEYFGVFHAEAHPALQAIQQEKLGDDFYTFWGEVLMHAFALTLQYNPQLIVTVTGNEQLAGLDPFLVMDEVMMGLDFDIKDLNPDYLIQKLDIIHNKILPADVTGAIDRGGLTTYEARAVDPRLAQQFIQDGKSASQKVFTDVQGQLAQMMLGFEAQYTENDPTAPMKLQFLQTLMQSNPKVQQWMQQDERFKALLENYAKNLSMSVEQEQNKQVGRIGVKPMGATAGR